MFKVGSNSGVDGVDVQDGFQTLHKGFYSFNSSKYSAGKQEHKIRLQTLLAAIASSVSIKVATMLSLETIAPGTGAIVARDLCGGVPSWPGTILATTMVESPAPGTCVVACRKPPGIIASGSVRER
jgi:hypothetical protein